MSILMVGASHRTASVELLERLVVGAEDGVKLRAAVLETPYVHEAVVISTCNRIEIYADVERFHGSVEDLTALLTQRVTQRAGQELGPELGAESVSSLYLRYDQGAVAHLFSVVTGLDSMVVGEAQILGQVRDALRSAQDEGAVGPVLNGLFQQALRVGKRAHAETDIDLAGRSLVSVALEVASAEVGDLSASRLCVIGAGSVAALTAATARRVGMSDVVVLSRTRQSAARLADSLDQHGLTARAGDLERLVAEIANADVVVSCTGAAGVVITEAAVREALDRRASGRASGRAPGRPLAIIDLALPRDVATEVERLPGVSVIGLPEIAAALGRRDAAADVERVREIVAEERAAYESARQHDRIAPTVVALRSMATGVLGTERDRLFARVPDLTDRQRDEVSKTLRRLADKLLHEPTVRVKQFAGQVPESSYAEALAALFALDPAVVDAVTAAGPTAGTDRESAS